MEKVSLNIKISFKLYCEMCEICKHLNITIEEFIENVLKKEINNEKAKILK